MGHRLATIDMGQKLGGCTLLVGELGPHVTQCGLGKGLPSYQAASLSIQPFGHNRHRHGPKNWGAVPRLGRGSWVPIYHNVAWAEAYLHTNGILIHAAVWPE